MNPKKLTDEQLDALLEADDAANGGNALALFARIHERRRRRAHAKAKAEQPNLEIRGTSHNDPLDPHPLPVPAGCACQDCLLEKLRAFWKAPLNAQDSDGTAGAMDYLLLTVADTLEAGDVEDLIFAALRVARKAWAWNATHLGPIEGAPAPEPKKKEE